ncbi:hypothetical protein V8C35DRAFT_293856 [Trichoderma chlorosporum]
MFVSSGSPGCLFFFPFLTNDHASRAIRIGDHGKRKQGVRDLARSQVAKLCCSRQNPCDGTSCLEMKAGFRYVHLASASLSGIDTFVPFFSPRLVRAKLTQKRWARRPISTAGLNDSACRRRMTANPVLRTPCH